MKIPFLSRLLEIKEQQLKIEEFNRWEIVEIRCMLGNILTKLQRRKNGK